MKVARRTAYVRTCLRFAVGSQVSQGIYLSIDAILQSLSGLALWKKQLPNTLKNSRTTTVEIFKLPIVLGVRRFGIFKIRSIRLL